MSPFGERLRYWRRRAGVSQLELSGQASTTARHLSFLECGRSRPGRDLVLRICAALDVPIRERNQLLACAGLAPEFPTHDLDDQTMLPVRQVLDKVLAAHEPYPAWVVGRGLRFMASNRAAEALFPGLCQLEPDAIIDFWYGPGPLREMIENWQDVVWAGVASLRREAARTADAHVLDLVRRAEAQLRTVPRPSPDAQPDLPLVCSRLKIGGRVVRTVSTVMRFDAAVEVTLAELRVEISFPPTKRATRSFNLCDSPAAVSALQPQVPTASANRDRALHRRVD